MVVLQQQIEDYLKLFQSLFLRKHHSETALYVTSTLQNPKYWAINTIVITI